MTFRDNEQQFQLEHVKSLDHLIQVWPFFLSGLEELNKTLKRGAVPSDEFFLNHVDVVTGNRDGVVLKVNSVNGKPLAYVSGFENTGKHKKERSLLAYAIYSNRKNAFASRFAAYHLEKWAKENGFKWLHAYTGRTSGSAIQWVKRFHGFELDKYFFVKEL